MEERNDSGERLEGADSAPARGGDRRGRDRRRVDRRAPPPPWRRPAAFVVYGVVGALLVVVALRTVSGDSRSGERLEVSRRPAPAGVDETAGRGAGAGVRDAPRVGDFERLLAEGNAASGQRVRTVLYCRGTRSISLSDVDRVHPAVAELADAERRVPAAECKWSTDPNAPDFLLLVPAEYAERFAAVPRVRQGFINRRRVQAELIWLGRTQALALRTAGVLQRLEG